MQLQELFKISGLKAQIRALHPHDKTKLQSLVVGDDNGFLYLLEQVGETYKIESKSKVSEKPISFIDTLLNDKNEKDRIIVCSGSRVIAATKKLKEYLNYDTLQAQTIKIAILEGSSLYTAGEYMMNEYSYINERVQPIRFYLSPDLINAMEVLYLSTKQHAILGCQDSCVRVLEQDQLLYAVQLASPVICMHNYAPLFKEMRSSIRQEQRRCMVFGMQDGTIIIADMGIERANILFQFNVANLSCFKPYDFYKTGYTDLIIATQEGVVEIYSFQDGIEKKFSKSINEGITSLEVGQFSQSNEIVLTTFSGRILLLREQREERRSIKDLTQKQKQLKQEVEELQKQVSNLKQTTILNTKFNLQHKIIKNDKDGSFKLIIDCQYPIYIVSFLDKLYINKERNNIFQVNIRDQGLITCYVTPFEIQTCQSFQFEIKPLMLYSPINKISIKHLKLTTLTIKGAFTETDIQLWMNQLAELPRNNNDDETQHYLLRNAFLDSYILLKFKQGAAQIKSDSIIAIYQCKSHVFKQANERSIRIEVKCECNDESIQSFLENLKLLQNEYNINISFIIIILIINQTNYNYIQIEQIMYKPPELINIEQYVINKKDYVGKGQSGVVYRCTDARNKELQLCAKVLYQKEVEEKLLKREIDILKWLTKAQTENKNLVKVYDILEDKAKKVIYLIMEYCDQGDLKCLMDKHKKLKSDFTEEEATNIVSQVIQGYMALYKNRVIHRNIKPTNILISQGVVKIANFKRGRVIEDMNYASNFTKVGTTAYAAPQMFIGNTFSSKADVYSLGVIYYQMIHGSLPIEAKTQPELIEKLRNMEKNPIKSECQNEQIKRIIDGMLEFSESKRLSWEDLFKEPLFNLKEIRQQSKRLSFKKINFQLYYRTDFILINDEKDKLLQIVKILLVRSDLAKQIYLEIEELHCQNNSQLSILNICLSGYRNKLIWNAFGILFNQPEQIQEQQLVLLKNVFDEQNELMKIVEENEQMNLSQLLDYIRNNYQMKMNPFEDKVNLIFKLNEIFGESDELYEVVEFLFFDGIMTLTQLLQLDQQTIENYGIPYDQLPQNSCETDLQQYLKKWNISTKEQLEFLDQKQVVSLEQFFQLSRKDIQDLKMDPKVYLQTRKEFTQQQKIPQLTQKEQQSKVKVEQIDVSEYQIQPSNEDAKKSQTNHQLAYIESAQKAQGQLQPLQKSQQEINYEIIALMFKQRLPQQIFQLNKQSKDLDELINLILQSNEITLDISQKDLFLLVQRLNLFMKENQLIKSLTNLIELQLKFQNYGQQTNELQFSCLSSYWLTKKDLIMLTQLKYCKFYEFIEINFLVNLKIHLDNDNCQVKLLNLLLLAIQ